MAIAEHSEILDRPSDRTVSAAVELAQRAPSLHNTQPWRWSFDGRQLHLFADSDRALPATDPHGRERAISCGAVLHHARTAFAAQGWHTDTVRLPDIAWPEYLAVIDFRPWPQPAAEIVAQASAIARRYTDRLPMDEPPQWNELAAQLQRLVALHGLGFDAVTTDARARLAALSESASAARSDDWMYQNELRWWAGHSGMTEGVPASGLISDSESARVDVARNFPSTTPSERRPGRIDRARLIALSSPDESLEQWLRSGEALSAILLECTAASAATCTISHLTELPAGRRDLAALLARHDFPQLLVRIGAAPSGDPRPCATPRRGVDEVLTLTNG